MVHNLDAKQKPAGCLLTQQHSAHRGQNISPRPELCMLPVQDVGMPLTFAGVVVASAVTFFRYAAGQGHMCTAGFAFLPNQLDAWCGSRPPLHGHKTQGQRQPGAANTKLMQILPDALIAE